MYLNIYIKHISWSNSLVIGSLVTSRKLDLMILMGLFQTELFYDSIYKSIYVKYMHIYKYIWTCVSKNTTLTPVVKSTYHSGSLWHIKANCTTVQ